MSLQSFLHMHEFLTKAYKKTKNSEGIPSFSVPREGILVFTFADWY